MRRFKPIAGLALLGVVALGPAAHADDYNPLPSAPVIDEIVSALVRLPAIGAMLDQIFRPVPPAQADALAPTIRFTPTFSASSLGVRAVATF